jgi:tripartite-type tricarboxylate transporter receptor subunit TctC
MVEAGKLRPLAVTSASRFPALPDIPAVSELVPGVVVNGWFAVIAPVGTPAAAVARLNREIAAYLDAADVHRRLLTFGLATEGAGTPESTGQFIGADQERWRALTAELDVRPQ